MTEGAPGGGAPGRPLATIRVDARGTIVEWDAGARALYGYDAEEVLGRALRDLTLDPTGPVAAPGGSRASEVLARSEARFRALVQHSSDLVGIVDADLVISYVSPSIVELLGVAPSVSLGRPIAEVVHRDDRPGLESLLGRLRERRGGSATIDVRLRHAGGEWRVFELVATNQIDDPAVAGIVVNGRDVTERRRGDRELRHRATHDPLTDLPDRATFLAQLAARIAGRPDRSTTVVAIGLDRFQTINESIGHHAGDQVLVTCAERLRRALPPAGLLARVGGDTFVVAVPDGPGGPAAPRRLAERLLGPLHEPFRIGGRLISMTARAGIAVSDGPEAAATLLRHADASLHRAKVRRTDPIAVFEPAIGDQATRRLELEQALPHAVAGGQLRLHLQPIVATGSGTPVGVEALVRWAHPTLGLVPPADFIPLAEETGDIVAIGRWVLERACALVAAWDASGHHLELSVNLSPYQFLDPGFAAAVGDVLGRTGLDPRSLTLEVTESALVEEGTAAIGALGTVRDLGVRLAIDDFGTGYSSLVYLRRLDVDALKIDRSFIDGLTAGSDDDTIVRTIIELARALGLGVVAEGVETEQQRRRLVAHGCPLAQGFLFARPLEPDALIDLVTGLPRPTTR